MDFHAVQWGKVQAIFLSWIITPVIAGVIAYFTFTSVQRIIFNTRDPLRSAKRFLPIYIFFAAFIIVLVTLTKGIKHLDLNFSSYTSTGLAALFALVSALIGKWAIHRVQPKQKTKAQHFASVEKMFGNFNI